jgi:ribonuclease R
MRENRRKKGKATDRKEKEPGRTPGLSAELVAGWMESEDRPVLLREILQGLGLGKDQRQEAKRLLKSMGEEGRALRIRGNRYGLPARMNLVVGRIKCHPDGYGFVIPEKEGEEDIFVSPRNMKEAMHGDRVVARVESVRRKGKEGSVIRILDRAVRKVVGKFMKAPHYAYVVPDDERVLQEIYIPDGETKKARPNQIVVAEITRHPTERARPEGRVTHILGYPDDPEVEPQVIIHKYDLPFRFSSTASREALSLPRSLSPQDFEGRVDLRGLPTFTIDGENAKDFDDAVSINEEADGGLTLYVSISDVSHYVPEEGGLDGEAYLRGTSVYFPDRAIPMFPPELSNEICCLQPRVDRLTVTVELRYDAVGEQKGVRFYPSVIRSNERLTYTVVRKILVDGDDELRTRFVRLVPSLETMSRLCRKLQQSRVERGALDFDLPEPEVILNLQGETEEIVRAERNLAHQMIEEFMIAANEAVAGFLEKRGAPSVYRIHEPPNQEAVEEFRRFVSHLGYRMEKKRPDHGPVDLQRVLKAFKGKSEERVVNNILLRSMKWAKYSGANAGHFGLASPAYTHFTSPIRRYPDLMVHRILKETLLGRQVRITEEAVAGKAEHLSRRERVAMEAEREILDRYRIRFMKDKVGEVYGGVISGVTAFGFFVELKEIFVEGLVRMTSLHDDYYHYYEDRYCLMGERTRKIFRIGDDVKVRLDRVDVERRHIDFELIERGDRDKGQL